MRIALTAPILLAALAFDAGAYSASASPSSDAQQVNAAVAAWRLRFDPLYAYRTAHCSAAASLRHELVDLFLRLADRSRATACERLTAHPETIRARFRDGSASEEVADYDARPGERLRFGLQREGSNWTISAVSADANDGTTLTLYERAGKGTGASTPTSTASGATIAPAALSRWMPDGSAPWQVMHVITYGQSLSQGFFARPVLSTRQRYESLRFTGGVRADDGVKVSGEDAAYAGLVPLVETTSAEKAETPTSGTLDMVMQLVEQENLRDVESLPYRLLGSAPGEGSQEVAQLSAPGPYYQQLVRDIRHGRQLADAQHESYGVGAITWSQGEADDADRTSIAAYEASLRSLRADVDRDAKAITGQRTDVEMVTYQVATAKSFDQPSPHIALALLQASHDDPHIHLAVPMYVFRYVDGRHIDNRSARWLGAYYGLVIKRLVIDHRTWKPLEPIAWQRTAAIVTVRFNVPAPPLRWDTGQVAANRDYGFALRAPDGQVVPIRSAAITAPDTITITATQPIAPGTHLHYAFDGVGLAGNAYGPRGNLRDSQGDTIVFDDGVERLRLDNWCVIFDVTL